MYVDTGWTSAHEPDKYLSQSALVRAFGWLERTDEAVSDRSLPELRLPDQLIPVVAFAQYALRLGQALKPGLATGQVRGGARADGSHRAPDAAAFTACATR